MTDAPSMAGKYVLVTAGTGGIGKVTAAGLAALGARISITGRDQGRAAPGSGQHCCGLIHLLMRTGILRSRLSASLLRTWPARQPQPQRPYP